MRQTDILSFLLSKKKSVINYLVWKARQQFQLLCLFNLRTFNIVENIFCMLNHIHIFVYPLFMTYEKHLCKIMSFHTPWGGYEKSPEALAEGDVEPGTF